VEGAAETAADAWGRATEEEEEYDATEFDEGVEATLEVPEAAVVDG
jgi:hypothetical protein